LPGRNICLAVLGQNLARAFTPEVNHEIQSLALAVFALLGSALPVTGLNAQEFDKKARPPKPEELVGAWIGFWEDGEFTRLELRAGSTGVCAFVAPVEDITHDYGVQVYRITRWTLDGWTLVMALTPTESRLENIYFKGRVSGYALELEVGGTDRKWKEKLVLNKEWRIQASNSETKNKIDEAQKK
jgi:hypothetical protein